MFSHSARIKTTVSEDVLLHVAVRNVKLANLI
jgi:hypothetical protein